MPAPLQDRSLLAGRFPKNIFPNHPEILQGSERGFFPIDIWLLVLGTTLPQIGVIMAADFFLFRKEKYRFETIPNIPNYRWEAWLAWLLGTIAACLTHFKIFELTQVPALDGMSVAFLIYILTMLKSSPQKTHQGDFGY